MHNKLLFMLLLLYSGLNGQKPALSVSVYDGIFIIGYVDRGAFFNCTGPNINASFGNSKYILGMLPSLRFKVDNNTPKNAFVTPNLGIGFTYSYKIMAIQIPLYYNSKTANANGRWHTGIGIGLRLNGFNKSPN